MQEKFYIKNMKFFLELSAIKDFMNAAHRAYLKQQKSNKILMFFSDPFKEL